MDLLEYYGTRVWTDIQKLPQETKMLYFDSKDLKMPMLKAKALLRSYKFARLANINFFLS